MRRFLLACVLIVLSPMSVTAQAPLEGSLSGLEIFRAGYPRAFFFRQSEYWALRPDVRYENWERMFGWLMGIEGKVFDEELIRGDTKRLEFFTEFKRRHPEKLVLSHYNGNARDPRDRSWTYFPGHWSYYEGTVLRQDLPATGGVVEIRLDRPDLFRTDVGRLRDAKDDVGLCGLDARGRPDWSDSEQVELLSVDRARGTISVRRGCYGTTPRAFRAGRAYAAAHAGDGPWATGAHFLWDYNFSTACPRDSRGRTCHEAFADELSAPFAPGAPLASFDGLQLDALMDRKPGPRPPARGLDLDADGRPDGGVIGGENTYGAGVLLFLRRLRERLGPNKLVLADSMGPAHQRGFGIINGVESEGWPNLTDPQILDWSGGLNRQAYWAPAATPPVLNYINHKFSNPAVPVGPAHLLDVPPGVNRLVFAAAVFTDSAITFFNTPPAEPGERWGVWDELCRGRERRAGWLGLPDGPTVVLAEKSPDGLGGAGVPPGPRLRPHLVGDGARFTVDGARLVVEAADPRARETRFVLRDVPCEGHDLFISTTAAAAPRRGGDMASARVMTISLGGGQPAPRGGLMTWVGRVPFTSGFAFRPDRPGRVDLVFSIEGSEQVTFTRISSHSAPDVRYRKFENGLVLANPSGHPVTLDLGKVAAGWGLRRLSGSPKQDTKTNNGELVSGPIVLDPLNGLFLVREKPAQAR